MVLPLCLSLKSKPNSKGNYTSSADSSPSLYPNLAHKEYKRSVESRSYNEVFSNITLRDDDDDSFNRVLQPNRECVQNALRLEKPSALTHLVSAYFDHSEHTAHLCLDLHRSLLRARSLYSPLHELLEILSDHPKLLDHHCQFALQVFQQFDSLPNPFPQPDSLDFDHICDSFSQLKLQADRSLRKSKSSIRRILFLCSVSVSLPTLSALALSQPMRGRESLRAQIRQLDAAGKGSFVLDNDLRTISCLVAHLHSAINDDKELVRVALEGGAERHIIQEVLKLLRKNNANFFDQLKDIEERICLCLNTVNRARNHLLKHIYRHETQSTATLINSPLRQDERMVSFLTCLK